MKHLLLILILSTSAMSQWTVVPGSASTQPGNWYWRIGATIPPPPLPGNEPWRGILDPSRAADWSHSGVEGGIPVPTRDCATIPPTGVHAWEPNHNYVQGDRISDSRGSLQIAQNTGTSGAVEPGTGAVVPGVTWPLLDGGLTNDGGMVWMMQAWTSAGAGQTDTANITNAVIACDRPAGATPDVGVVHLSAGHYYFTNGIIWNKNFQYPLTTINPFWAQPVSNVLVKGAGPMQTYLHFPRIGPCSSDICIQATSAGFTNYRQTSAYPNNRGSAVKWMGTSAVGTYYKGDTTLITGSWDGPEPQTNDTIFLDQNNDSVGICPVNVDTTNFPNCTASGASYTGTTATIVTSMAHGFSVGQCVGIGDVGGRYANQSTATVAASGFNTAASTASVPPCPGAPTLNPGPPPGATSWWTITAVGCIHSGVFADQTICSGSDILNAFQFNITPGNMCGSLPCNWANNGTTRGTDVVGTILYRAQATADSLSVWLSGVNGATMVASAEATQSARVCPGAWTGVAPNPACRLGEISIRSQFEAKKIVGRTLPGATLPGGGTCPAAIDSDGVAVYACYTISPPLYMPNWRSSQRPGIWFAGPRDNYDGVEGITYLVEHDRGSGAFGGIKFQHATNSWVRNVRAIDINRYLVGNFMSNRIEMRDNYTGGTMGGKSTAYVFEDNAAADTLIVNNICQHTVSCMMTSTVMGRISAYNYMVDPGYTATFNALMPLMTMNHLAAFYNLFEGNDSAGIQTDNMHGTGGVSTAFRQRSRGQDFPRKLTNRNSLSAASFTRGLNFVGMVMGTDNNVEKIQTRYIDDNPANASGGIDGVVFSLGRWKQNIGVFGTDKLTTTMSLRWGNYDSVTGTTRWCGTGTEPECSCGAAAPTAYYCRVEAEIPTQPSTFLAGNAIPANHALPASFFLSGPPAYWTTTWGTPGWPAIGPDVDATGSQFDTTCDQTDFTSVGGPNTPYACDGIGHKAYQIPAQICFNRLPVDSQFQKTYTIIGGSQNNVIGGGGVATLQVADNSDLVIQPVNLWTWTIVVKGVLPDAYNGTWQVTGSTPGTPGTVTFWLPTNPGPITQNGTFTLPNYKQYDAHMCYPNEPL